MTFNNYPKRSSVFSLVEDLWVLLTFWGKLLFTRCYLKTQMTFGDSFTAKDRRYLKKDKVSIKIKHLVIVYGVLKCVWAVILNAIDVIPTEIPKTLQICWASEYCWRSLWWHAETALCQRLHMCNYWSFIFQISFQGYTTKMYLTFTKRKRAN